MASRAVFILPLSEGGVYLFPARWGPFRVWDGLWGYVAEGEGWEEALMRAAEGAGFTPTHYRARGGVRIFNNGRPAINAAVYVVDGWRGSVKGGRLWKDLPRGMMEDRHVWLSPILSKRLIVEVELYYRHLCTYPRVELIRLTNHFG